MHGKKCAWQEMLTPIPILHKMSCANGGIYLFEGAFKDQYTGKTTVPYSTRTTEHVRKQKTSSVYKHREKCRQCNGSMDFSMSFIEDYIENGGSISFLRGNICGTLE